MGSEMCIRDRRWANQCLGEASIYHDNNRRTSLFRYVGQNYASKSHSANLGEKILSGMIQDLYDEVIHILIWVYTNTDDGNVASCLIDKTENK